MKKVLSVFLLSTTLVFGQIDDSPHPNVKRYSDSIKNITKNYINVYKIEFGELYGDWKAHKHREGWHIIINPRCNNKRKAVIQALDAVHFKLKKEVL